MQLIANDVRMFTGLYAGRVYLIEDLDGLTLIDTSLSFVAPKIIKQIEATGRKASDVKRILITHAHPDHIGGLPALKAATGARVIASAGERPVIEGKLPPPRPPHEQLSGLARLINPPMTALPGTPVDQEVGEGDILSEVMGGLCVLSTPGHAPDHIAFWQPERRILFCGDVMVNWWGLGLPFSAFTFDMNENIRSLKRLAELDPAIVCFGHGPPLREDAARRVHALAERVSRG